VVLDKGLFRKILETYHDHPSAGHPGILKVYQMVKEVYWWSHQRDFVMGYVQGCVTCQSTKLGTMCPKIPIMLITPKEQVAPFVTIALDLITDLSLSQGYDSILTITDHDCSKAAVFLPYSKTIIGEGIAQLYVQHVQYFHTLGYQGKSFQTKTHSSQASSCGSCANSSALNRTSAAHITLKWMASPREQISDWSNICTYMEISNRTIGHCCYPLPSSCTMLGPAR
jgi:hypothetical protein